MFFFAFGCARIRASLWWRHMRRSVRKSILSILLTVFQQRRIGKLSPPALLQGDANAVDGKKRGPEKSPASE